MAQSIKFVGQGEFLFLENYSNSAASSAACSAFSAASYCSWCVCVSSFGLGSRLLRCVDMQSSSRFEQMDCNGIHSSLDIIFWCHACLITFKTSYGLNLRKNRYNSSYFLFDEKLEIISPQIDVLTANIEEIRNFLFVLLLKMGLQLL